MQARSEWVGGIVLVGLLSALALWIDATGQFAAWGMSALTLAIILGMLVGNTIYPRLQAHTMSGVMWSKNKLLRLGIILYGFRLTLQQVAGVGASGMIADGVMLTSTFLITYWLGQRWLKIDEDTVLLIGAGGSICGAAAIMATEPVVKANPAKVTVAVATVVIFGTLAMFLYPQMYQWGIWPLNETHYGLYIGSTVHEVAQVVAAGEAVGEQAVDMAVTAKMIRVMLLAPFLLILAAWLKRRRPSSGQAVAWSRSIPWFAFVFLAVVGLNSLQLLPASWVHGLVQLDTLLLTMAMTALGLTTHVSAIRQAGVKPLLLGLLIMGWLVVVGGLLQLMLMGWLG